MLVLVEDWPHGGSHLQEGLVPTLTQAWSQKEA